MKASGINREEKMAVASKFGLMDRFMKDTGKMIKQMVEVV